MGIHESKRFLGELEVRPKGWEESFDSGESCCCGGSGELVGTAEFSKKLALVQVAWPTEQLHVIHITQPRDISVAHNAASGSGKPNFRNGNEIFRRIVRHN